MKFYKSNTHKPLSKSNFVKCQFSKVQSGLTPTLRSILQNSSLCLGIGKQTLPADSMPPHYSKQTFLENFTRLQELQVWYEEHRDICERVRNGDYSDFNDTKPVVPEPPIPSAEPPKS